MSGSVVARVRVVLAAIVAVAIVQVSVDAPAALGQVEPQAEVEAPAQNPELSVALSLPEKASQGQTVAATISISNNSSRLQTIVVKGIWLDPTGDATVTTRSGLLLPGQTVTRVIDYLIDERSQPGLHEVTVSVEGRAGTSSAKAIVEVT